MLNKEIMIKGITQLDDKAKEFLKQTGENKVLAFFGEMGVGKTTFIKALCKRLHVTDEVTSPTFAIVNEYNTSSGQRIFHFDFYRIKKQSEIYDFGYEEYLYSGNYCLIEWPEVAKELLPDHTIQVYMTKDKNENRVLKF